jgi:hypothetical protein
MRPLADIGDDLAIEPGKTFREIAVVEFDAA